MFKNALKPTIVLTAVTKWSEPPRMRHYIAKYLSNQFNVIFFELDQRGVPKIELVSDDIIVCRVGLYLSGLRRLRILGWIFDEIQLYVIKCCIKKVGARNLILINFKFDFHKILTKNWFLLQYIFINDDFINMNRSDSAKLMGLKKRNQEKSIILSDRVFVSSFPLGDDVSHLGVPVTIVLSGHDFKPQYNITCSISEKVRVCFMGYIHDKLEVTWISELAKDPRVLINLIGPVESLRVKAALSSYNNIKFLGPMTGTTLQEKMSEMDVFIMPYTSEPVNQKATVPAKLFQYLACGKPVVSAQLDNLIALPYGFIYCASDKKDFVEKVHLAVLEDNLELQDFRVKFSMNHSWENRITDMIEIIKIDKLSKHPIMV